MRLAREQQSLLRAHTAICTRSICLDSKVWSLACFPFCGTRLPPMQLQLHTLNEHVLMSCMRPTPCLLDPITNMRIVSHMDPGSESSLAEASDRMPYLECSLSLFLPC